MTKKITLDQLEKILANRFETGGNPGSSPVAPDPKKPGVIEIPSRFTGKTPAETLHVTMTPRKTVLVVTPFMSEDPAKAPAMVRFAKRCTQDSIKRGEAALCSQLFYWDTLNMNVAIERDWAVQSMLSWVPAADLIAVYVDFGVTQAMKVLINLAQLRHRKIEYRTIGNFS